jgi:hypothetical protein
MPREHSNSEKAPICANVVLLSVSPVRSAEGDGNATGVGGGSETSVAVAIAVAVGDATYMGRGVLVEVGSWCTVGVGVGVGDAVIKGTVLVVGVTVALGVVVGVTVGSGVGEIVGGDAVSVIPSVLLALQMVSNVRNEGPAEPSPHTHPSISPFFNTLAATPTPE